MLPLSGRGTADCYVCTLFPRKPRTAVIIECDEKVALDVVPAHSNTPKASFSLFICDFNAGGREFGFASGAALDCCERGACILEGDIVMAGRSLSHWI